MHERRSMHDPRGRRPGPRTLEKCYPSSGTQTLPEGRMTIACRRRDFIAAVWSIAAAWSFTARAQQTERKRRIGVLIGLPANDSVGEAEIAAFQQALQKLGW